MTELPPDSFHPLTAADWRNWLEQHHSSSTGVWLVLFKQASGQRSMGYEEAVEVALCFGWIDSKPRLLDEYRAMRWFSPRKKGSAWSRINKQRIAALHAQGLLHATGLACVEQAQTDGSWNALDAVERLEVPPDLQSALLAHAPAASHFDAFPRSVKRSILEWIGNAKTPATRSKRVLETAALAQNNQRANQWVRKG